MPLFSAALRYTTLMMLGLTRCKINDRALQCLGSGIHEHQHLKVLLLTDNSFTEKGFLSFLILFINKKSVLERIVINSKLYDSLIKITGYSFVISQITHIRRIFSKKPLSVEISGQEGTTMKYFQSIAAQVVELPAPFSRRHVL